MPPHLINGYCNDCLRYKWKPLGYLPSKPMLKWVESFNTYVSCQTYLQSCWYGSKTRCDGHVSIF